MVLRGRLFVLIFTTSELALTIVTEDLKVRSYFKLNGPKTSACDFIVL